jgi:hypothetical protein
VNFPNSFEDSRVFLLTLVDTFLGFAQKSFDNPKDVPSSREKRIKIQKRIVHALPSAKQFC